MTKPFGGVGIRFCAPDRSDHDPKALSAEDALRRVQVVLAEVSPVRVRRAVAAIGFTRKDVELLRRSAGATEARAAHYDGGVIHEGLLAEARAHRSLAALIEALLPEE